MHSDLDAREMQCLILILEEYIRTGEPVSSRQASKAYGLNLSPATLRNVMWNLSEKGYLEQPHSSAGRIPTDLAYRLFVDHQLKKNTRLEIDWWKGLAKEKYNRGVENLLRECLTVLSEATKCASLASAPNPKFQQIKRIEFFRISEHQVVSVLVTESGVVKSNHVQVLDDFEQPMLTQLGENLTLNFQGRALSTLQSELLKVLTTEDFLKDNHMFAQAFRLSKRALESNELDPLIIQGRGYMLTWPELKNTEAISSIYQEMEEGWALQRAIEDESQVNKAFFRIGQELKLSNFDSCALVAAHYGLAGAVMGSIGVIGPKRMDYNRVAQLVEQASVLLSKQFEQKEK